MVLIAISPDIAATAIPTMTGPSCAISMPASIASGASIIAEPRIDGIEIRKTNLTANFLSRLQIRLPKSVEPDLEIPGQMAIPCTVPINRALRKFILSIPLIEFPVLSARISRNPVIIRPIPIGSTEV